MTSTAPPRLPRLTRVQRRRIAEQIPPRKCSARNGTGAACANWAVVGTHVCQDHGGAAPQTRALADRRVTLAQALAEGGPGRSAAAILLDNMATLDLLARSVKARAGAAGSPIPVDLLGELEQAVKVSATMAKMVADLKIDSHGVQLQDVEHLSWILQTAGASLGMKMSHVRVSRAVRSAMKALEQLGPNVEDRAAAVAQAANRIKAEREAQAEADRDAAAQAAAELRSKDRAAHLIELKRAARQGRPCDVCGVAPPAVKAIASGAHSAQDPSVGAGGPSGRVKDQLVPETRSDVSGFDQVLTGELLPADPRAIEARVRCPGCQRDRYAPGHDQQCGYYYAATDRGGLR